ncbi:MAG: M48 family metalloprotease [Candidatus Omnitrophica bacterium]|nr:M48 family metalloprotease [Candidatus Omnitrophota bacterium]
MKIILILLLLFSSIFSQAPVLAVDMDDIVPISAEKEKKMGAAISKQVEKQFDEVDDPLVQKRFEEIGAKLAKVCDRHEFVYHFKVLKAKEGPKERYYNAFTLPGGYIYMFEPLLEALETDDKIAAVTAHEIGHICGRHVVKRLQSSLGVNLLMILAVVAARDGRTVAHTNEAITQLMMSYSREDEFEADRLSVEYVKRAGFDPEGVLESLQRLKELRKKGPDRRYIDYRSHPYLSERIAAARKEIKGYADFDSYINLPHKEKTFD